MTWAGYARNDEEQDEPQSIAAVATSWLTTVGQLYRGRVLGLFVEQDAGCPALARILPTPQELPRDDYSLELRFASWLASLEIRQLRSVPTYLLPWLPISRALVFPLRANGRNHGALAIDVAGLVRADVTQLEDRVSELASEIASTREAKGSVRDSLPELFVASIQRLKVSESRG